MGYAKYVGRVGALAVALGLGAAVATSTPGIAFADETEPDPNIGTNQPNETQPDPTPNPDPDPTPPPPTGEQPPSDDNNQQQNNNGNVQTTPGGGEVRTAEPGEVLNTGGYQEEEKKPVEPTGTTPPPPPPPPLVVPVPQPPPVVTPKDEVIPQTVIDEKGKSKDALLQQESDNKLKTTLNLELSPNNVEEGNGAQLRGTSWDGNAEAFDTNAVMTMFSTTEDDNEQVMQTMAAAAAPAAPKPTLTSIFTGFLALVGLGPSTGAGTPSFPFVPAPIFDAIFAFVRRIEATLSNETPIAKLSNPEYQENGDMSGIIAVEDDFGDGHTYVVSQQGEKGTASVDANGKVTYIADAEKWEEDPDTPDNFTVTVSDNTSFHIHAPGTQHTTTVTVDVLGPVDPDTGVTSGQLDFDNPNGGPVSFDVDGEDADMFEVDDDGKWTFRPSDEVRHEAAKEVGAVTEKTYTVDVLDAQGNVIDTVTVTVPVAGANFKPEFVPPVPGAPDPTIDPDTGIITGSFQIKDGDLDDLDIEGESEYGQVVITGQVTDPATKITTVSYKVIPSDQVEQDQGFAPMTMMAFKGSDSNDSGAMQTMALNDSESESLTTLADEPIRITFTIRDNYGGTIYHQVDYSVDESGALVDVTTGGAPQGPVIVDSARNRAYQITYVASPTDNPQNRQFYGTTYVTVIDTTTGKAIGSGPAAIPGKMQTNEVPQLTGDGSHMFVTTEIEKPDGSRTTYVAVIDTETGELVDNDGGNLANDKITVLHGQADERLVIKGDKAYLHTVGFVPGREDEGAKTYIAVFSTADGELASGSVIEVAGGDGFTVGEHNRIYVTSYDFAEAQTKLTIIDTETGSIVDDGTLLVSGQYNGDLVLDDDPAHRRAYFTTRSTTSTQAVWAAEVDTETGEFIGTPIEIAGATGSQKVVLSSDGQKAYLVTSAGDYANGGAMSTTITVIDGTTGAASTLKTVDGVTNDGLILDNSGRAYLTTYEYLGSGNYSTTIRVIDTDGSTVDSATVGTTPASPLTRSTDGKVVYQAFVTATEDGNGNYVTKTVVVVFDTDTGTATPEIEMLGRFQTDPRTNKPIGGFTDKGDKIYVVTESYENNDPDDYTDDTRVTHVAIIDTATGRQLGDPVDIEGRILDGVIVDGDRTYQRTVDWSPSGDGQRTRIGVIDAETGALLATHEIDGNLDQYIDGRTGEVFFDRLVFADTDGDGTNDRAYQAATSDNSDGTYTVRVATLNTRNGALIQTESIPVNVNGVKILEVNDNGRVYLVVHGQSGQTFETTYVAFDPSTGEIDGEPIVLNGPGTLLYDDAGNPSYFLSGTTQFSASGITTRDVTFTPLAGQPWEPITVPGNATGYGASPNGTLAYVVSDGDNPDESKITVIDLATGEIVATSSTVPGHAGIDFGPSFTFYAYGGLVFDADGKGYLTTWIKNPDGSYTTQVTGLPGLEPTTSLMSFGDMSVTYPEDDKDKTAPLQPGPTMVDTGNANEFNMDTGPMALLAV
jgi:VCBS repeat-containing protein